MLSAKLNVEHFYGDLRLMMEHSFTKLLELWSEPKCAFCGRRTIKSFWRVYGWAGHLAVVQIHCCAKHLAPEHHNVGRGDFDTEREAQTFILTEALTGNNNE